MKQQIKSIVVLVCICAAVAVMLAVTNYITAPIIKENENAAANEALLEVMPNGKDFKKVDISAYTLPKTVTEVYSEANGGYVIRLTTTGYASGMNIMCGIKADGTVSGAKCLSSGETLGYEKTYGENFVGLDADGAAAVDTISGATLTSGAYRAAVADAFNAVIILGGGSVDLRTEEEILQENLSVALPEAEGKFSKLLIVETVEGIDKIDNIYKADNASGYVCVMGDSFVGVGADGKVKSDTAADVKQNIESVMEVIIATELYDIDLSAYEGLPKALVWAQKTQSGNYVVEIKAAGFGINGDTYYRPSGIYIVIQVSVTADGKIIDCMTISQQESANYGAACEKEEFYGQFDGRTEDDYKDIDAIAGSSLTTKGYTTAIGRVFDIVKIFEGGAGNEE